MQLYSLAHISNMHLLVDPYLRVVFVKIMCKSIIPFSRASFLQYFIIIAERHPTFSGLYITKTGFPSILRYLLSLKISKGIQSDFSNHFDFHILALLNNYFSSPDYFLHLIPGISKTKIPSNADPRPGLPMTSKIPYLFLHFPKIFQLAFSNIFSLKPIVIKTECINSIFLQFSLANL